MFLIPWIRSINMSTEPSIQTLKERDDYWQNNKHRYHIWLSNNKSCKGTYHLLTLYLTKRIRSDFLIQLACDISTYNLIKNILYRISENIISICNFFLNLLVALVYEFLVILYFWLYFGVVLFIVLQVRKLRIQSCLRQFVWQLLTICLSTTQ